MSNKDLSYVEKLLIANKFVHCEVCGDKLYYLDSGRYECRSCGTIVMDDFGKVKAYLDECGSAPAAVISQVTGVKPEVIEYFLKKGRVEIAEGSKYYLKCKRCGCSIRYGSMCEECGSKLAGNMRAMFNEDVGERPKRDVNPDLKGKVHHRRSNGIWYTD